MARPLRAVHVSPLDREAKRMVDESADNRLILASSRAEKWIAGLTGLTALVGTVLVVKGPEDVTQLVDLAKFGVAVSFAAALALLAVATYKAYSAAFGNPFSPPSMMVESAEGLHSKLQAALAAEESRADKALAKALILTFCAVGFISLGTGISWFAPEIEGEAASDTCLYADEVVVARIAEADLSIAQLSGGLEAKPC